MPKGVSRGQLRALVIPDGPRRGWARFMYEDKPTLAQAGDVVHQLPGIVHYLFDYSPDMEYLEIVSPADFKTVDMPPATDKVRR
jgi:quercetin dioxygenase-like cupin family protein